MTPIADMVTKMIAAGVAPDMIALAVSTCEAVSRPVEIRGLSADETTQRRREYDRIRARERREKEREIRGHPPTSAESAETHIIEERKKDKVSIRGSRLSVDTIPLDWREWSASQGMTLGEIDGQFARFRDYWLGKPGKDGSKTDWLATWRNWCRTFLERNPRSNGHTAINAQPEHIQREADRIRAERKARLEAGEKLYGADASGARSANQQQDLLSPRAPLD